VVRLTVSEDDFDVNRLEQRVEQARDQAGRELLGRALEVLDGRALANHPGVARQRRVERRLDTRLGHVVFRRWRVKAGGKTTCLLDRLLGLERYSRASPGLKQRGVELASRTTYRQAATVLSEEAKTPASAQSVHGWVQRMGVQVEEQELAGSARRDPPPEVVVSELDDTLLRSQEPEGEKFALKLGIAYSRKRPLGPQRRVLADKVVYGGEEDPETFAERFYARVEGPLGVEGARHVLVKGDGAEWIHQVAEQVFPGHVFQLDRWSRPAGLERITQFAGHLPRLLKRLQRWVYEGRVAALIRSLRHLVGADARSEQARQELLGYVTRHGAAITAVDRLRPQVSPQARPLLTHGKGAMEKNV
jgi:hypothetical protein